jgi:hypothetical protein
MGIMRPFYRSNKCISSIGANMVCRHSIWLMELYILNLRLCFHDHIFLEILYERLTGGGIIR